MTDPLQVRSQPSVPDGRERVYAADWVLPVSLPPIRDGAVVVEGREIAWVGERRELPTRYLRSPVRAHPHGILLPGWVDAHAHLNLTGALGSIPGEAATFDRWIRGVIAFQAALPPALTTQAIRAGLDLLALGGTTTVAHLSTDPDLAPFLEHPLRSVVFHEAIGFAAERTPALLDAATAWLERWSPACAATQGRVSLGIAPHAPYSVSGRGIAELVALALGRGLPVSIHLSETRMERELLETGQGPLRRLLQERGALDPCWTPPGLSPAQYVAGLGLASVPLVTVHLNDLDLTDEALLARTAWRPVWCPGSSRYFGHPTHPAPRLLRAGLRIALGTDSLASNLELNMLGELRRAGAACGADQRESLVRAATLGGAEALGLGDRIGSLQPGKAADMQLVTTTEPVRSDPLTSLFEAGLRVRRVLVDGEEVLIRTIPG